MSERIQVVEGDIARATTEAIVNAANETLLGGGGVDGAIHRAAGPGLLEECRSLGGCPTGEARLTGGYDLPAAYVIHTVGPVWHGGTSGEDRLLAACYRGCLEVAAEYRIRTLAFPAISTGGYRFPVERATRIAVEEVMAGLRRFPELERVHFFCFGMPVFQTYSAILSQYSDPTE